MTKVNSVRSAVHLIAISVICFFSNSLGGGHPSWFSTHIVNAVQTDKCVATIRGLYTGELNDIAADSFSATELF